MEALLTADNLIALVTLTALEIVLGVDNVIFISILAGKLPAGPAGAGAPARPRSRRWCMRILLLFSLTWIIRLTEPLFTVLGRGISGRDLILLGGGLFLLAKATHRDPREAGGRRRRAARPGWRRRSAP